MTPKPFLHLPSACARAGRRSSAVRAAVAAALALLMTPAARAQSDADQLQELKEQARELQQKIDALSAKQAAQQGTPAAATGAAAAPPSANPKPPAIAAGPLTITFGGFTELAVIYRNKNETADVGSNFNSAIPFPNSTNFYNDEFRMSARQSRISILTQADPYAGAKAEAYFETDFLGAAPTANSNESNSYNLRMRNIYGRFITDAGFYLLAGQNWSLLTLQKHSMDPRDEDVPLTIDAQYVPGFTWTRNPQVRVVQDFGHVFNIGLSLESPQGQIATNNNVPTTAVPVPGTTSTVTLSPYPSNTVITNTGGSLFAPTVNYAIDPAPDVVFKVSVDPGVGHYELSGLARWFRSAVAGNNNTITTGAVGAGAYIPLVPDFLTFRASGLYGNGIGRYGSAQLPDVVVESNGLLSALREYQVLIGLILTPVPELTLYGYLGREQADPNYSTEPVFLKAKGTTALFGPYYYGYGNPYYNNSGCYTLGGSCAANTSQVSQVTGGLWWKYYQGQLGNLQLGVQGSYTQRNVFSAIKGGAPSANIFIGMVSFRYYPYQH